MKNLITPLWVIMLIIFFQGNLLAQELMPRLALGATGGYHVSFMQVDLGNSLSFITGGNGGFQLQYMSRRMLGFETGLTLGQVGWSQLDSVTNNELGRTLITVLELPLYSHLSLGKGRFRILIDAGPYLRFFVNEKQEGERFPGKVYENKPIDVNSSYGLSFAGGFGWRTPKLIVQLKGNFHLGLTNYFTPVISEITVSTERSAGGSISVMLPIGQKYIDE